jgi:hypothetical protein
MANTTSTLGRAQLIHPDLGYEGGSTLETYIKAIYSRVSDFLTSRFYLAPNINNADFVVLEHNFKCSFSELKILLYTYNEGTGELTRIVKGGTPDLDNFVIAATGGFTTTKVTITNNTGSQQDVAVVITQGYYAVKDLSNVSQTAPTNGQILVYRTGTGLYTPENNVPSTWTTLVKTGAYNLVAGDEILADTTGGAFTLTLPAAPTLGHKIRVIDFNGSWGDTNKVTIGRNANKIGGTAADLDLTTPNDSVELVYNGTDDWRIV